MKKHGGGRNRGLFFGRGS